MKLSIINFFTGIFLVVGLFFVAIPTDVWAAVHGMSPRDGYVRSSTGAGVGNIKIIEYTDWCPPNYPQYGNYISLNCPVPQNCHVERSVRTDASGHYFFEPMTPPEPDKDSSNACDLNVWWMYTCWNPTVLYKIETDRNVSDSNFQLVSSANAADNVCPPVQHPTTNVTDSITTDVTCDVPPACNVVCQSDNQCGGIDGCTSCLGGVCRPPQSCNSSCTNASDCAYAPNGCNTCVPNGTGGGTCQVKPPACNDSCERDADCAGAVKDGCTVCAPNETGKKVCQTPFDENACKCDGFNAINLQNPANSNFQFESFAKVEGGDVNKAVVKSIQFQMMKSTKSNPTGGTIIASSDPLTPQIVSSDANKVRYRSTWSVTPPAYDNSATYRVFAKIKCDRKFATKSASLNGSVLGDIYNSDNNQLVQKELNYSPATLAQSDSGNLELGTLKDGYFTKITETDACSMVRFEYGQY